MPMDGITLGAIADELSRELKDGKIDKIQQPRPDTLLISVRSEGSTKKLLLTVGSGPRLHLTRARYDNPQTAPGFCMLMRKHLTGGRISSVTQKGNERVVYIDILSGDEMGDVSLKRIAVELMGKYSNVILIGADGNIIDSLKRVGPDMSRMRLVQPHLPYIDPPSQDKLEPTEENIANFIASRPQYTAGEVFRTFTGFSKQAAQEAAADACGLEGYMSKVRSKAYTPMAVTANGELSDFLPFAYNTFPEAQPYPSFSSLLDDFYAARDMLSHTHCVSRELHDRIRAAVQRCEKKKSIYLQKQEECKDMEQLRLYGELLTANLHCVKRGSDSVTVTNYYSPQSQTVTIPLDIRFSPQANAQKYFRQYSKLRTASRMLAEQMRANDDEYDYLSSVLVEIENCTDVSQLAQIRTELIQQGYLHPPKRPEKNSVSASASSPMRFEASDGTEILVGRNNLQNDELTLRTARPEEMWLHIRQGAGSHVIIRSDAPSREALELGAMLAAYYSSARGGSKIAVAATRAKFVHKMRKARPGMVIYENETTYYITPQEDILRRAHRS